MKYNRTKNATRNMVFGVIQKIYTLAVPFLIRTLFIYIMGVEYLGLNSLFTSILSVLSLAELGVGSAMTYSMYKPLAEDDTETVCALMNLYKKYYRIIGAIILAAGLAIIPALPMLIKDGLPADVNLYVLYFLNLVSTVVTYWLFAYKNCIITANQRMDITSKISVIISTLMYLLQILVLALTHNYYLYICVSIFTSIISNVITAIVADKLFPQFLAKGNLPKENIRAINKRVRDLFTAKLGAVVIYSSDTIVISAFLGLRLLAQYQNYYFIMNSVAGVIGIIYTSITSIIGNSIVAENQEKNYRDFCVLLLIISWISGICSTCFLSLYQPFMELWVGEELLLEFGIVICFCIQFFVMELNKVLNVYKDASGMWSSDKFRPLVVALLNLGLNLLSVRYLGLYGIILSTILPTVFVGYPWLIRNLSREIFQPIYMKEIFGKIILYIFISAGAAAFCYWICSFIALPLILAFFVRAIICMVLSNLLFLLIYHRSKDFQNTLRFVNEKFLKGRMGKFIKVLTYEKKGKMND